MSVFGGRRTSSPAQGRARSADDAPRRDGDTHTQSPHFRAATVADPDPDAVEEARSVLESLRVHLDELDRREQALNGQFTLLERDQHNLRLQTQQLAAEQLEQRQALDAREHALGEREKALAQLAVDADEQQQAVDAQQTELDRQRADSRDELWAEIAGERDQLRQQQADLDQARAEFDRQRARQRSELESELVGQRRALREQQAQLDQARAEHNDAQAAARTQRELEIAEHTAFLDRLRAEFDQQQAEQSAELAAEFAEERRRLQQQQAELEQARTEFHDAQAAALAQRELEIAEHTALLDQLRAERLEEVEARESDVSRREVDLIKRTRFQEEHLARLRAGIEARQAELERRRAALNIWVEHVESTARGRLAHLRKYRDVLEQREQACDDAWQALAAARDQQQAILGELRQHVADEQSAFTDEQRALAGDFRRHAELLQLREQDVERRAARTEQSRDELERRQHLLAARETAVREAADWLAERIGTDAADLLVPRDDLPDVPAADVASRRAEIAGAQRQLAQWHQELHDERESFAQLIADREQRLHTREDALRRQLELLAGRESELQQAQTRDRSEREQTFAVLESLVDQIERRRRS